MKSILLVPHGRPKAQDGFAGQAMNDICCEEIGVFSKKKKKIELQIRHLNDCKEVMNVIAGHEYAIVG